VILRSLRVEGWRCFAGAVETGPLEEGIHVVHAPNGTGKSTLFEALRRALFDRHRVGGEAVKELRPWGRDLAPAVTVEFAHGGEEYRLAKRFLSSPSAKLERRESGAWTPLAEGEKADERVLRLLGGKGAARGLSGPAQWGFFQALWAPQGGVELSGLSDDLVAAVRKVLGSELDVSDRGGLEKRVRAAVAEYYTRTGRTRSGADAPAFVRLEEQRRALEEERTEMLARLDEMEDAQRKVQDCRARRTAANHEEERVGGKLAAVRDRAREYADLAAEERRRAAEADAAAARHAEITSRIERIAEARTERAARGEEAERLEGDLRAASKERAAREEAVEVARLAAARTRLAEVEAELGRVEEAREELRRATEERDGLAAPDEDAIARIREVAGRIREAELRLERGSLTLTIELERDARVRTTGEDGAGDRDVAAGETVTVRGAPEVGAEIDGVGRVRARGPEGSAEEMREERRAAREELRGLTADYGTDDLGRLEALAKEGARLDGEVAKARAGLEGRLSGRSEEELRRERAKAKSVVRSILEARPELESAGPDGDSAEAALEAAEDERRVASERETELRVKLAEARRAVRELEEREARLVAADGLSDGERAERQGAAALDVHAAKAAREDLARRLAEYEGDPREEERDLERGLEAARAAAKRASRDESDAESRLRHLAAEGYWSRRAEVEERMAKLDEEIREDEFRAEAIKLLGETLDACREEALASVAGPVEEAASLTFRRIAGSRLGRVRLDEGLAPGAVAPERSEEPVGEGQLSGGEREQLHLAVRLALAEVLARDERQLVVLDDVLTATDTGRMARVLDVLREASERLQVLVLTCHPQRYYPLERAGSLDLEQALHA